MEYRRRRSARRRNEAQGGALRALILMLMFGAAAYLLLGTGVGRKLKEGYAASLINGCAGGVPNEALPEAQTPLPHLSTPAPGGLPSPTSAGTTAEVSLPGIEIHMLELGIFDSAEALEGAAANVKARGGAGYVYNDGGSLRLILAAYPTKAQAESVKQSLASEGIECGIFTVVREGVQLLVTADEAHMTPIRTAFASAYDTVTQLDELSIDMDANSRSVEYVKEVLSEIAANARTASQGVEASLARSSVLELLCGYYTDVCGFIENAAGASQSETALSSAVKELKVKTALRYAVLLEKTCG